MTEAEAAKASEALSAELIDVVLARVGTGPGSTNIAVSACIATAAALATAHGLATPAVKALITCLAESIADDLADAS